MTNYRNQQATSIFQHAVEHHQNGDLNRAKELYETILETVPNAPIVLFNLGLLLYQMNHMVDSELYYRRALDIVPDDNDILYNLALSIKAQGRFVEALQIYKKILASNPDEIDSRYNLGCCQKDMGDDKAAIATFTEVSKRAPDYKPALNNLAFLHHKNGNKQKALENYSKLLALDPTNAGAKHMVNALQGKTPERAPQQYVTEVFDTFAEYFETRLIEDLEYSVPELLFSHFSNHLQHESKFKCLDIGCGTGLGGMAFRSVCNNLVGIDLSQKMLEKAKTRNIYDELFTGDIMEYLKNAEDSYSLIVASDVFTYIGELRDVFFHLRVNSKPGCFFCFSVEDTEEATYELKNSGRFGHSTQYIKEISMTTGWSIVTYLKDNLRKERGKWITGSLFLLQN